METIIHTITQLIFLSIGVYLGSLIEKKGDISTHLAKILPQKKRAPLTREQRRLNRIVREAPPAMRAEIIKMHAEQKKRS